MYPASVNIIGLLIWTILWNYAGTDSTAHRRDRDSLEPSSIGLVSHSKRVQTPDRSLGIDTLRTSPVDRMPRPPLEKGHLSSTTQWDDRSRSTQISPTSVPAYPTRTQTVDFSQGSQQPTQQNPNDTNISSQPTQYSSDTVSTAAEGTESEEISVQTPDPAVPNLPESSTTVKSLQTSVEDIEQTKSQISIPLLTDSKQGETPSLENDISRVTSGQSINSTDGESSVTATRPPQILQGASKADMVGLSESSGVLTVTTEYRSPANPDSMVTHLKSTTADLGTRFTSETILDQAGIFLRAR